MLLENNNPRITLSLLWTAIMFLMIFADTFSIIIEIETGNTIEIPIDVKSAMAIAALMTAIPILMIVLSWILPTQKNRLANIITAILTGCYVIIGGSMMPHYVIIGSFEIILLIAIINISLKWEGFTAPSTLSLRIILHRIQQFFNT